MSGDGDLQITFRPRTAALAEVRRELRAWLGRWVPPEVVDELVLAADELCANAVDAAAGGGSIQLDVRCDGSAVHLAVSNPGNADTDLSRTEEPTGDANPLADRGRGLTIVRAFTDSLAIVNVDGRTVARVVRLLPT